MKERLLQRGLGLGSGDLQWSGQRTVANKEKASEGFLRETSQRLVGSSNPQWRHCSVSGLEWCLMSLCPVPVVPFLSMLLALSTPASALQDSVVLGAGDSWSPDGSDSGVPAAEIYSRQNWWPAG